MDKLYFYNLTRSEPAFWSYSSLAKSLHKEFPEHIIILLPGVNQ